MWLTKVSFEVEPLLLQEILKSSPIYTVNTISVFISKHLDTVAKTQVYYHGKIQIAQNSIK